MDRQRMAGTAGAWAEMVPDQTEDYYTGRIIVYAKSEGCQVEMSVSVADARLIWAALGHALDRVEHEPVPEDEVPF